MQIRWILSARLVAVLALAVIVVLALPADAGAAPLVQVKKLEVGSLASGLNFGGSVAMDEDTAIVGLRLTNIHGPTQQIPGEAYVFERHEGGVDNWGQAARLVGSNTRPDDFAGWDVAVDDDTAVMGAVAFGDGDGMGEAYVFQRDQGGPGVWGETVRLTPSDGAQDASFGQKVAISGDTILVGAVRKDSNAGAVYVYERDLGGSDNWGEAAKLTASDRESGDFFGEMAIAGNTIVVGAGGDDTPRQNAGAVYIYERDQTDLYMWHEVKKLLASDGVGNDVFGASVAVFDNRIVVGAPSLVTFGRLGAAYIFERHEGGLHNWGEVAKVEASDGQPDDQFGDAVAAAGNRVIVGAYHIEGTDGRIKGAAYVFEPDALTPGQWNEVSRLAGTDPGTFTLPKFGTSVAARGDLAIIGATGDSGRGAAYIFQASAPSTPTNTPPPSTPKPPTATPTPTSTVTLTPTPTAAPSDTPPAAVGGVSHDAELRELPAATGETRGPASVALFAGAALAGLASLSGVAWWARRRLRAY